MVLVPHKDGYEEKAVEDPELDFLNSSHSYTSTTTTTTSSSKDEEGYVPTLTDALLSDIHPSKTPTKTPPKSSKSSPNNNNNNNDNNSNNNESIPEEDENTYVPHWLRYVVKIAYFASIVNLIHPEKTRAN